MAGAGAGAAVARRQRERSNCYRELRGECFAAAERGGWLDIGRIESYRRA